MPCMKCSNGKWRYGLQGNCQFDTLKKCQDAAAAIHIKPKEYDTCTDCDNNQVVSEYIDITKFY